MELKEIMVLMDRCQTVDDLFNIWCQHYEQWKKRKDFNAIVQHKDMIKFRLTWVVDLAEEMRRYDEAYAYIESDASDEEVVEYVKTMKDAKSRIESIISTVEANTNLYPVGSRGFGLIKAYIQWVGAMQQTKFNYTGGLC